MPLLSPGVALHYEMADFDVADRYCFALTAVRGGVDFTSAMASGEDDDDFEEGEPVHLPNAVLADSHTIAVLSQGSWLSADLRYPVVDEATNTVTLADLPPFLLSRAGLRELRAGATRLRSEWGGEDSEPHSLSLTQRTTATVELDGETIEVDVLVGANEDMTLMVLDDDDYPLVIERVEGDNFWRLQKLGRAQLRSDEDGDE